MTDIVQMIREDVNEVQGWIKEAISNDDERHLLDWAIKRLEEVKLLTIELRDEYEVTNIKLAERNATAWANLLVRTNTIEMGGGAETFIYGPEYTCWSSPWQMEEKESYDTN